MNRIDFVGSGSINGEGFRLLCRVNMTDNTRMDQAR